MSLIDEIRAGILGRGLAVEDDPIQRMAALEPPPPPGLDPQVLEATGGDMQRPGELGAQGAGHPDVLSFVKELESKGAFKSEPQKAPKGQSAAQTTVTSEQGGPSKEERASVVAQQGQADLADGQVDAERLLQQSDELRKRALDIQMRASVEDDNRKRQEQENADRQTRLREQQEELASQNDEPINADRYIENKSLAGKGFALISAAIYGYLGGRGQPPVVETLTQMAKEDVQAQIHNNAQRRDKRNSLIDQYERQYGDTTLVAKRLEADKLLTFAKKAQAEAMEAKSTELKASAEDLAKKLRNQVGRLHGEIQKATWDKPVQVSTTYKPSGGGGGGAAAKLAEAAKLNKLLAEGGVNDPATRASMLKAAGLPAIDGRTMDEQKLSADQAEKARKATELTPEAKTDVRKRVDGLAEMVQGMKELDDAVGFKRGADGEVIAADEKKLDASIRSVPGQVAQSFSNALPWGMNKGAGELVQKMQPEDSKALDRARDKIVFGQAKAEGAGALGDAERDSYRQRIPTDSPLSVQRASAQIWRARRQQYDNLVGEYGKDAVDEMLRARGIDPKEVGG